MLMGMWNYAIKAADVDRTAEFYVEHMGVELKSSGVVLGCDYRLLRLGET